jgi:hypothetical protein
MGDSTTTLLTKIIADFPAARARLAARVSEEFAQLEVGKPVSVRSLATFDPNVTRPLSRMPKSRFEFASKVLNFHEEWLAADAMPTAMRKKSVRSTHLSLRNHWEGSAPMLFPDKDLGLFSFTRGVPEDLVYLVWKDNQDEPELWKYSGMDSLVFENLDQLLQWHLT